MKLLKFANLIVSVCALSALLGASFASAQSMMEEIRERVAKRKEQNATLSPEEQAFKEQREQEYRAFKARYFEEFVAFKAKYNRELAEFRQQKLAQWGEVDISDQTRIVDYVDDDVKTVVDFDKQEIVISVIHDEDEQPDPEKVKKAVDQLDNLDGDDGQPDGKDSKQASVDVIKELVPEDEVEKVKQQKDELVKQAEQEEIVPVVDDIDIETEKKAAQERLQRDENQLDVIADQGDIPEEIVEKSKQKLRKEAAKDAVAKKENKDESDPLRKKRITRFKIKIPTKSDEQRIAKVKPFVMKYAAEWDLPAELIVAVIHTESSFNPKAVSSVPAYGLMQIVPQTAGTDVNEYLFKKREPLDKDYLFIADKNVEAGSAYLHILDSRYLKAITNPESRLYCAISAYNTGVGNVARAFSQGRQRKMNSELVEKINQMDPQAVYDTLIDQLPYDETRRYLQKVHTRMNHYKNII